jgi:anhydro-N-acetylmuramic acid kinase
VNSELLEALLDNSFLKAGLPKTTGPELFNLTYLEKAKKLSGTQDLNIADTMATLNRFSARCIVDAMRPLLSDNSKIFVSGGGMHNPLLLDYLKESFDPIPVLSTAEKGIDPDAKEAVLFAILANEAVAGNADNYPQHLKNFPATTMGKISFP